MRQGVRMSDETKKTGGISGPVLDDFLKHLRLLQLYQEEQQDDSGSATSAIHTAAAIAYANVIEGLELFREETSS